MKLYLDENLSPRFRHLLDSPSIKVFTYQFMNWQGKKNGELLKLFGLASDMVIFLKTKLYKPISSFSTSPTDGLTIKESFVEPKLSFRLISVIIFAKPNSQP